MDNAFRWVLHIIVIVNHPFPVKIANNKMFVPQTHVKMVDIVNRWVALINVSAQLGILEEIANSKIFVMLETHAFVELVKMINQIHLDLNVKILKNIIK
jgi:hypothetical protein